MRILAADTSAKAASVAVTDNGKLLGEYFVNIGLTHSQTFMPMCEQLLKTLDLNIENIDVLAISAGPGSFTGIRIGMAAIKGMAFGRDIKCVSVSTLESLAYNVSFFDGIICPVMDARCGQVYNALFENNNGRLQRIVPDRAISIEELNKELLLYKKKCILVGDGAELCYNHLDSDNNIFISPQSLRFQRASSVAAAAEDKPLISANEIKPIYLRLPQAERELIEKKRRDGV